MRCIVSFLLVFTVFACYGQQSGKYISFLFGTTKLMNNRTDTHGFNSSLQYTGYFHERLAFSTGLQLSQLHARLDVPQQDLPPDQRNTIDPPLRIDDRILMASLPIGISLNAYHHVSESGDWNVNVLSGIAVDTHLDAERTFSRGEASWSNKLNVLRTQYYLRYDVGAEVTRDVSEEWSFSMGYMISDVFLSDYQYKRTLSSSLFFKVNRQISNE